MKFTDPGGLQRIFEFMGGWGVTTASDFGSRFWGYNSTFSGANRTEGLFLAPKTIFEFLNTTVNPIPYKGVLHVKNIGGVKGAEK